MELHDKVRGDEGVAPVDLPEEAERATITVVHGDLIRQQADAIVNPTDNAVRGGGGIDGAIHRAGGPAILRDCIARFPTGLATGDAGWTTAGDLPARWVIHAVSASYDAAQGDPAQLRSCYRRALQVADALGATSIAFPLFGAGAHRWPLQAAIETAIETILSTPTRVADVRLTILDEAAYRRTRAAVLLRCPPPVADGSIGALFDREPDQYSLRGDAYLWRELRARFATTPLPSEWSDLRQVIAVAVEGMIGEPLADRECRSWSDHDAAIYLPEFDPGHGMSAGGVHVPWWSRTGIPILLDRFEAHRASGRQDTTARPGDPGPGVLGTGEDGEASQPTRFM